MPWAGFKDGQDGGKCPGLALKTVKAEESMKDREKENRLAQRIAKAKRRMSEKNIEMMLISKEENKNYLSMFYSSAFHIILTHSKNYLLTDFRYIEAARELEPLYTVVKLESGFNIYDFLRENAAGAETFGVEMQSISIAQFVKIADALGARAAEIDGGAYGASSARTVNGSGGGSGAAGNAGGSGSGESTAEITGGSGGGSGAAGNAGGSGSGESTAEITGGSGGGGSLQRKEAVIVTADGIIEGCRIIKEEYELERIKKAASIADAAFEYILGEIRPGITEKEIAWLLEKKMRESGASGLSFETICAAGVHSSMPHAHPTDSAIENGDFVTMDFGCIYDGYCSDMTRTVAVGSVTDEQRKIYDIVLRAQKATCEMIRPGITGREADACARDIITEAGYGKFFGHGLGHGVGLEIHEAPTANPSGNEIFEKNMLITIEPGIYLPEKFGVRIEDLSIVSESAIINLVASKKELIIL